MFEAIVEQHGRLDVLVCSAAVETRASVVDTTDELAPACSTSTSRARSSA